MYDFQNKVIIITGASTGLGQTLARLLDKRGAKLALIARNRENLNKTLSLLTNLNNKSYICDISDKAQVKQTILRIRDDFGRIDILINNAGIIVYQNINKQSIEEIESQINTNFLGAVYLTKETLPTMMEQYSGHIINISSTLGNMALPNYSAYCASKFALTGFTESIYYDLKDHNIKVSLICPGYIKNTEIFKHESFDQFPEERHPKGLTKLEVSKAIIEAIENNTFLTVLPKRHKYYTVARSLIPKIFMKKIEKLPR